MVLTFKTTLDENPKCNQSNERYGAVLSFAGVCLSEVGQIKFVFFFSCFDLFSFWDRKGYRGHVTLFSYIFKT